MALPSCVFSASEICGHFGLVRLSFTAQLICWAMSFSQGLNLPRSGSDSSDWRGGSSVVVFDPKVQVFMLAAEDRYSIHNQAASAFLVWLNTTRESPAMVVAHPAGPLGIGATAHLPLVCLGNEASISPPNQAPASYMATFPVANATLPSHEFEL